MSKFYLKPYLIFGLLFIAFTLTIAALQPDPRSIRLKKALDSFQIEPGMRIELIASEPLVIDPVALVFDEDRQMYVVEDRGYPDPAEGGSPTRLGRIALLKDTDGDGKYDKRTEFATGLTYPNGILPWKGGVFVTCSPDLFYLKDTNGDGVADIKKVVLTGFFATQTAQIRTSHPILGLDGWIYVTGGLNGGTITSPEHPDRPAVSYKSADGRFHPETFEFQVTGGKSQFGLTFDSYGRRFGSSNRHPVMHTVMDPWYLKRNPNLLFNESVQNVSKTEADAVVYPISNAVTSADFIPKLIGRSHAGTFTAASGLLAFNGTALTPAHQGNIFICESAQNLVQRQLVNPETVSFRSKIPYEGREFLSSTDEWFRPVFLQHGPEGALYLADMHRKVIDHPSYVPAEARPGLDWESGKTDGRIYRIVRKDFKDNIADISSRLSSKSSKEKILASLASSEEWERATAHRLLLEKKDASTTLVNGLGKIVSEGVYPESRARALWLLHSLNSLNLSIVKMALKDQVSGVREQAVLLAGGLSDQYPELVQILTISAKDEAMRVRFNTALVLGSQEGPGVINAMAVVAARDGADQWVRAGVLSGIEKRVPQFLAAFKAQKNADPIAFSLVMQDLGRLLGNGGSVAESRIFMKDVLDASSGMDWRVSSLLGLAEGASGRAKDFSSSSKGFIYALQGEQVSAIQLDNFISATSKIAENPALSSAARVRATALLGFTDFDRASKTLQKLLDPGNPPELLLGVVSSISRLNDARGAAMLTAKQSWSTYTPRLKSAVTSALVSKTIFIKELFRAIEKGDIKEAEISSADRTRLLSSKDVQVSDQAKLLFKELEGGDRMKIYQGYKLSLSASADGSLGKAVFQKSCSACHTYQKDGGKVGPDLTGVKNQPAEALLLHILVPNYEVLPAYQSVSVNTKDGRTISGWLVSETENSLTLRTTFGTDEAVLRKNIANLGNSGLSLMPDGLEQNITKDEMSKLIAYLKGGSL